MNDQKERRDDRPPFPAKRHSGRERRGRLFSQAGAPRVIPPSREKCVTWGSLARLLHEKNTPLIQCSLCLSCPRVLKSLWQICFPNIVVSFNPAIMPSIFGSGKTGENGDPQLTVRTEKTILIRYLIYLSYVSDGFAYDFCSRGTASNF